MALLPVGRYTLRVEQTGFRGWNVPEIVLAVGDRLRVDVRLEVGQLEQTVEVQAQAPALQSDSSSLGSLVNERAVQDLPLNGRNFIRLAQAAAGANESVPNALSSGNRPDDRRRTSSVAVNGQRDFVKNFWSTTDVTSVPSEPARQAGHGCAGRVQGPDESVQRRARSHRGRSDQPGHQVGRQRVPWLPLRVLSQRYLRRQEFFLSAGPAPSFARINSAAASRSYQQEPHLLLRGLRRLSTASGADLCFDRANGPK